MKIVFSLSGVIFLLTLNAQTYRVKAGIFIIPTFQSGATLINIASEALNKKETKSFQLTASFSSGAFAVDAPSTTRKWLTFERIFYIGKPEVRQKFFYTFFIEAGSRKILPGYSKSSFDAILNEKKSFEINPGASIAVNFKIKKRWGLDFGAGPKLIIASHSDRYYNGVSSQYYNINYKDTRAAFRVIANLSYQF